MDINWGLLRQADIPGAIQAGVQAGQKERAEREGQSALAAWAANPDDTNAAANVLRYNPDLGLKIMNNQQDRRSALAKKAEVLSYS